MFRAQSYATFHTAILLAAVSFSSVPALAQTDGRWAFSLGGGPAYRFTYRHYSYGFGPTGGERFGFSGLAVAGATYRCSGRLSLRADAGYLGYQKELELVSERPGAGFAGMWPSGSALTVQMPFLSVGARLYAMGPAANRPCLYIEGLSTLWVTRWRERVETRAHYDFYGNYYPRRVDQDAFTTLEPGFTAGTGLLGPIAGRTQLDVGMRYLFSTGAGRRSLGLYSTGDFKGLRQPALVMSVRRTF